MLQISPSQISEARICSARYYFNRVEKLPNPVTIPLVYGTALDRIVEAMVCDRRDARIQTWAHYEAVLRWVYEKKASTTSIGREELDRYLVQAEAVCRHFFDNELQNVDAMQTQVINKFEAQEFRVHQVWDLLTIDDVIVDYKAPLKRFAKKKGVWEPKSFDHIVQLYCYWHGFVAEFGYEPTGLEVHYLMPPEQKVRVFHPPEVVRVVVDFEAIKDDAEEAVIEGLRIIERAKAGRYQPRRGFPNFLCRKRFCSFHEACVAEFGGVVPE